MFKELGLKVCDDELAIKTNFDQRKDGYLKGTKSPNPLTRAAAQVHLQNAQSLLGAPSRKSLLDIVYQAFSEAAKSVFLVGKQKSINAELEAQLANQAEKNYSLRSDLAFSFVSRCLSEINITVFEKPPDLLNFRAVGGIQEIRLSWDPPAKKSCRVVVKRQGKTAPVFAGSEVTCTDGDVQPGVAYTYFAHVEIGDREGAKSSASAACLADVLNPSQELVGGVVKLAWKLPFAKANVRIFRRLGARPSIRMGGAGLEPGDNESSMVRQGNFSAYSEPGIEGAVHHYLIIVDEGRGLNTPGVGLQVAVPKAPQPPRNAKAAYRFDSGRDVVEVEWQPDGGVATRQYVVVRCEGGVAPKKPSEGQVSQPLKTVSWVDNLPGMVSGKRYTYAVFSLSEGIYSHSGSATWPVDILSEVTALESHAGDAELQLVWQPPRNVSLVQVRRLTLPGAALDVLGNSRAMDKSVVPGQPYHYRVECVYANSLTSKGVEIIAQAGGPPDPMQDFLVMTVGSQIHCTWAPPARGSVRVWRARMKPAFAEGSQLTFAQRDALLARCGAELLRPGHQKAVDAVPEDSKPYYFGLAESSTCCVAGPVRECSVCPGVKDLQVMECLPGRVVLTWAWPDGCTSACVLMREDNWPAGADDPTAASELVTLTEFHAHGSRVEIPTSASLRRVFILVLLKRFTTVGTPVFASPDDPNARAGPVVLGPKMRVNYDFKLKGLFSKSPTVEMSIGNSWPGFGGFLVVAGAAPDVALDSGETILEVLGVMGDGRVSESLDLAIPRMRTWTRCYLKLFVRNPDQADMVDMVHPPTREFKI